jgi:hypothetical protein
VTGSVADPAERQEQILALIDQHTLNLVDMDDASITFEVYDSFGQVDEPEPFTDTNGNGIWDAGIDPPFDDLDDDGIWDDGTGVEGVGAASEIVQYTVEYDWHVMTPFMAPFLGDNGDVHLRASIVLRNEPWDAIDEEV